MCFHFVTYKNWKDQPHVTAAVSRLSFLNNGELHLEWAVDIIGGGDVGSFSGLPEALQCWWLHVDDVGLQFVSPDCLNGLTQTQTRGFDGGGVIPNN